MKVSKKDKQEAYELLKQYKGQKIACCIKSVSRSGMTRRMEFYFPDFRRITWAIATILEWSYNVDKGLSVGGCGMDMIFHTLSTLNYAMCTLDNPGMTYQEKSAKFGSCYYQDYFINANNYSIL